MSEFREKLRYLVFNNLISLPGYKLNKQYQKIFKAYTYSTLDELIKNNDIQNDLKLNQDNKNRKSIEKIYYKPNKIKLFRTALISFNTKYIKFGIMAFISFLLAFLTRTNYLYLILIGVFSLLIFLLTFFIFFTELSTWIQSTNNAFSFIDRQLKTVDEYIDVFEEIEAENIDIKADMIVEYIVNDEILGLNYDLWKKDILGLIFAFIVSVSYVYIMGDAFLEQIQWIANTFNFNDFEIVKNLNVEILTLTIIFPIGLKSGSYIYVSALKNRNKRLRQSLKIVQSRIQKRQD